MASAARQLESKALRRRLEELRTGKVKGKAAASVFRKARSTLR